jgi:hypothetical protein
LQRILLETRAEHLFRQAIGLEINQPKFVLQNRNEISRALNDDEFVLAEIRGQRRADSLQIGAREFCRESEFAFDAVRFLQQLESIFRNPESRDFFQIESRAFFRRKESAVS